MISDRALEEKLDVAVNFSKRLLDGELIPLKDKTRIPLSGGVYLFHERLPSGESEKFYVGIAKNLQRRIHTDHLSAELKDTMSALRRSLQQVRKLEFGSPMQIWLKTNCAVSIVEIEDPDMRKLVESLVVAALRPSSRLLNKA